MTKPTHMQSRWQRIREDIHQLTGIDKTKLGLSGLFSLTGALIGAAIVVGGAVWALSAKWSAFEERQHRVEVALQKVEKHDGELVKIDARLDAVDRFCCPGLRAAAQSAAQTVAPAMVTR